MQNQDSIKALKTVVYKTKHTVSTKNTNKNTKTKHTIIAMKNLPIQVGDLIFECIKCVRVLGLRVSAFLSRGSSVG